jgi:ATP-dependent Clp protease ATP-binding subunit ClpA
MMFERFTREARGVVQGAVDQARADGSPTVEAEHMVLALAALPGPARAVLHDAGLEADALRAALERERERSLAAVGVSAADFDLPPATPSRADPRLGTSAKLVLERGLRAAQGRGARRLEAAHLLLGALAARAGRVPRALDAAGADRAALVAATEAALRPQGAR